jgi:hypothetical protein
LSEYVADALNSLDRGYFQNITVSSTKTKFGKGVPDEAIIPSTGKSGGILITKDINIQRTRMQYQLCKNYKLGVFFLKPAKGLDRHWEIVKMLINNWEEIISIINKGRLPFGYEISTRGRLRKL